MELKTKYQYTTFIYPYIVEEKEYNKYLYKLIKNKNCKNIYYNNEKDSQLYNYFLPQIREFLFNNFCFSKNKIDELNKIDDELKTTVLGKYPCVHFEYKVNNNISRKSRK